MLSNEENELLTRVGPGTPTGEMLRRYWWPVGFSEEVKSKGRPVKVRLLGEDFVLFRDGSSELGLLDLHCSHRGTALEFGRVEDNGIRCCYHGWLMTEVANVWSSLPNRKTAPSRTVSSTRPIMPEKRLALCSRTSVRSRCHCCPAMTC